MTKRLVISIVVIAVLILGLAVFWRDNSIPEKTGALNQVGVSDNQTNLFTSASMKWYKPTQFSVTPSVNGYKLPLSSQQLVQFNKDLRSFTLKPDDRNLLQNGFTISKAHLCNNVADFYESMTKRRLPIYITTDSILHLYHIIFDKVLSSTEEKYLAKYLEEMLTHTISEMDKLLASATTDEAKEAITLARDYSVVAEALLSGGKGNSPKTKAEIALINAHFGFASSPLFTYEEDYSQYVPRGHYTYSEKLKRYFRAMMWLGRMTFLVKGKEKKDDEALVSIKDAKKQTLAAAILATTLKKYPKKAQYETIYDFTSFFVGYSDDLTPNEYNNALSEVIGTDGNIFSITEDELFRELQLNILKFDPPAIYSGTGNIAIDDIEANPELLQKALGQTIGMRYIGQRFVIDSYFTGKLVYPTIGKFLGKGNPFTGKPFRTMPTALDIMNILGSNRAKNLLEKSQLGKYDRYAETVEELKGGLNRLTQSDWNSNLYMSWLYTLRALFKENKVGYQPFQQTEKWENRQLLSALGSWTALRHDTLLSVKQHYDLGVTGLYSSKTMAYVEGEPEFWARLLAMHNTMLRGISTFKFELEDINRFRMVAFSQMLEKLLQGSIAQLEERELSCELAEYLEKIGKTIKEILMVPDFSNDNIPLEQPLAGDYKEAQFDTALIADIQTDSSSEMVLEEATGSMMTMIVAYSNPDGSISLAYGPVYSYYEFKQPMSKRLTDKKWREMLRKLPPDMPNWVKEMISK